METDLSRIQLFYGIKDEDIPSMLHCLGAKERFYKKGETVFSPGVPTAHLGLVKSGLILIEHIDVWGGNSILGNAGPGAIFGEAYACLPNEPLMIHATAAKDSRILLLDAAKICQTCPSSCPFHVKLIRNLLSICASKNLQLSRKILHTGPKSIRGKLKSYFSDCIQASGSYTFDIPYNRQQLADYLNTDRSALSGELSKMQKEGLIRYHKNHFVVDREI